MKTFINMTKAILNVIMTIIIVFGIIFVGLFVCGIEPYVVESGSMAPTIEMGSLCFVNKNAKYDDMKVGDIIAFSIKNGAYVTHRIKSITDEGFETKGDASSAVDSEITTRDNFIGKNIYSIPNAGYVVRNIQKGKVILFTVIIILLLAAILVGEPSKKKRAKTEN